MPKYDLAGNPLPEIKASSDPPSGALHPDTPSPGYRPPPGTPVFAPGAPVFAQGAPSGADPILRRGTALETPAQRVKSYIGLCATLAGLILLTFIIAAVPPPKIAAPSGYSSATFADANVSCAVPDGWQQQDQMGQVAFTDSTAEVHLIAPPFNSSNTFDPLVPLHQEGQAAVAHLFPDSRYNEQPPHWLQTEMGYALVSEWAAAPELSRIHGYRATLLEGANGVEVVCDCQERDWPTLHPVFLHILQSITSTDSSSQSSAPQFGAQSGGQ